MIPFEPTSKFLKQASQEIKDNGNKHSLGLTAPMIDALAEIVEAAEDLVKWTAVNGSKSLAALNRLRKTQGKETP
jgi:hypothetical protein